MSDGMKVSASDSTQVITPKLVEKKESDELLFKVGVTGPVLGFVYEKQDEVRGLINGSIKEYSEEVKNTVMTGVEKGLEAGEKIKDTNEKVLEKMKDDSFGEKLLGPIMRYVKGFSEVQEDKRAASQ